MRPSAIILAVLLLLCLGSFLWAMLRFFAQPAGTSAGAKAIGLCGFVFGFLHLFSILESPASNPSRTTLAATLYTTALVLFWWSIFTNLRRPLSAVFSPDTPEHLIQDGPYRFIRHPFYCSYLLTWMAGALATQQAWLLATVAVMFFAYLRAAKVEEEKFQHSSFAQSYEAYRARTGLFVPSPAKWIGARGSH